MVKAAAEYEGPVYLRLGRLDVETILADDYDFQIGIANTLKEGKRCYNNFRAYDSRGSKGC